MAARDYNPWFNCLHPRPGAKVRVIFFPWAGGGSSSYAKWGSDVDPSIEVVAIRLPGRESRRKEEFATDVHALCNLIANEIEENLSDKPFAFFGHSMGIMLAHETAAALKENFGIEPLHMFLSGSYAPHSSVRKQRCSQPDEKAMHLKSDEDLLGFISRTGGTPAQLLNDEDFMKSIFLPVFRADLKLAFKFYRPGAPDNRFSCGITSFDGEKDVDHQLDEFEDLTKSTTKKIILPGGHFYLLKKENSSKIHQILSETLLE